MRETARSVWIKARIVRIAFVPVQTYCRSSGKLKVTKKVLYGRDVFKGSA